MFRVPGVDAGKFDVFPTKRRDVLRQSIRNVSTRSLQLCDCTVEIDGIPMDDRTDDEVETRGAERLALAGITPSSGLFDSSSMRAGFAIGSITRSRA